MNEEKINAMRDDIIKSILELPIGDGYNLLQDVNSRVVEARYKQIGILKVDASSQSDLLKNFEDSMVSLSENPADKF